MDRYIDTVMVASDRVDERARLLTRLCDTVAPLVGDLGPRTPSLIRAALLDTLHVGHDRPLDVVADVLDRLSTAVGAPLAWHDAGMSPGQSLAVGLCDARAVTDFALGAVTGIDRDEVATARDEARLALALPPAPPACTRRHADVGFEDTCITCMIVAADASTAHARVTEVLGVPGGPVVDAVVAQARRWQAAVMKPRLHHVFDGPDPWSAFVSLST